MKRKVDQEETQRAYVHALSGMCVCVCVRACAVAPTSVSKQASAGQEHALQRTWQVRSRHPPTSFRYVAWRCLPLAQVHPYSPVCFVSTGGE
jgi:hypothetical protein